MKVPKRIKKMIQRKSDHAMQCLRLDNKINEWLESKGIAAKVVRDTNIEPFFGLGCGMFENNAAMIAIEYLDYLDLEEICQN